VVSVCVRLLLVIKRQRLSFSTEREKYPIEWVLYCHLLGHASTTMGNGAAVFCVFKGFHSHRVRTVMENLERSWNFKMVISRPGKVMEKT